MAIDSQVTLKVLLRWALDEAGSNRAELARRLGVDRPTVDRLFDPHHGTRVDQYEAAFRALGKAVSIEVVEAA